MGVFFHETGECKYHNVSRVTSSHEMQKQQQQQHTTRKYRVSSSLSLLHEVPCWKVISLMKLLLQFFVMFNTMVCIIFNGIAPHPMQHLKAFFRTIVCLLIRPCNSNQFVNKKNGKKWTFLSLSFSLFVRDVLE